MAGGSETPPPNLLCNEDGSIFESRPVPTLVLREDHSSCLEAGCHGGLASSCYVLDRAEDYEYLESLIRDDPGFESEESISAAHNRSERSKAERRYAVNYLLDRREELGFQSYTIYLSIMYFDRAQARRAFDVNWTVQLVAIACLSLAAKMAELKPPRLSRYPIPREPNIIEIEAIYEAEIEVMRLLDCRLALMTPFSFFHYFATKFFNDLNLKEGVNKAVEHIMAAVKEINLGGGGASVIAAAAVLLGFSTEYLSRQSIELKTSLIASWGSKESEHVQSCYYLLRRLDPSCNSPISVHSPSLFSPVGSPNDNAPIAFAHPTRRRLDFDDRNKNSLPEKKPRQ